MFLLFIANKRVGFRVFVTYEGLQWLDVALCEILINGLIKTYKDYDPNEGNATEEIEYRGPTVVCAQKTSRD